MPSDLFRNEESSLPSRFGLAPWNAFRRVRELLQWDPFRELSRTWPGDERPTSFVPAFDVRETDDGYVIEADLPGVREQDLHLRLTGNRLTVDGKREPVDTKTTDTHYCCERAFGNFTRTFTLPEGVLLDHVEAERRDGALVLFLPRSAHMRPQRIPLKTLRNAERVRGSG